MRAGLIAIVVAVGIVVIGGLQAFFITNPAQQALVLQFGEVRQVVREPGLHFKIPFVQDVRMFDKRVLDLNVPAQEIIAADQKRLVVDAFLRYRIGDPVRFFQAVNNIREADQRLSTFAQSSLRAVLADATFTQIVREDRPELMRRIRELVANRSRDLGVDVVDMRIRRADLPEANSAAIFDRMRTEREQEATEIRAEGQEAGRRIRAAADRDSTVLVAEAERESSRIRGQGDARRSNIFANAYGQDPEFFSFYRAMRAYEQSLLEGDTRLVLSPDSAFFQYFNDPMGVARATRETVEEETDVDLPPVTGPSADAGAVSPEESVAASGDAAGTADDAGNRSAAADANAETDAAATSATDAGEAAASSEAAADQAAAGDQTAAEEAMPGESVDLGTQGTSAELNISPDLPQPSDAANRAAEMRLNESEADDAGDTGAAQQSAETDEPGEDGQSAGSAQSSESAQSSDSDQSTGADQAANGGGEQSDGDE